LTVSFYTLGCKLNFAETSTISRLFLDAGYVKVEFGNPTDIVVINTCTVTAQADKKCKQAITKAIKLSQASMVVVIGCFAEIKAAEIAEIQGVNLVLGNKDKFNIIRHIDNFNDKLSDSLHLGYDAYNQFVPSYSLSDRTRSFLKVQDGCDYHCAYCTIPKARGQSRNAPINQIITQAAEIANEDVKEIVLTGVNVGDFGKTTGETFLQLLKEIDKVEGIERVRIGSIEPNLISTEMIEFIAASNKIAAHFHIPLQSGCDKILASMSRRYKRSLFADKLNLIYQNLPSAGVGVDVIVGFPSETEEDFEATFTFIESLELAYLHVFTYSERPETKAATLFPKVKPSDAQERSKRMIELADAKRTKFYQKNIGKQSHVIFEHTEKDNLMYGFSDNYIKVEMPFDKNLIGKYVPIEFVKIGKSGNMVVVPY
jgi:threonylcarbamoyladenosine tRNA methylthiotransferase MtaB